MQVVSKAHQDGYLVSYRRQLLNFTQRLFIRKKVIVNGTFFDYITVISFTMVHETSSLREIGYISSFRSRIYVTKLVLVCLDANRVMQFIILGKIRFRFSYEIAKQYNSLIQHIITYYILASECLA